MHIWLEAMDTRNRLPNHTNRHAGNYHTLLLIHGDNRPAGIRRRIQNWNRHHPSLATVAPPSAWQFFTGTYAVITNWASVQRKTTIVDIPDCRLEAQMPCDDIKNLLAIPGQNVCLLVLFRENNDDKLVVWACGPQTILNRIIENQAVLAE